MKYSILFGLLLVSNISNAQTPTSIGGFELNTDVKQYKSFLKAETTLPIRFMEGISEVEIRRRPGFKSGYIAYGNCAEPGKIVRIKLKYKESSKDFFKELLEAYQDKFGKPKWLVTMQADWFASPTAQSAICLNSPLNSLQNP